jgi:hypothetical protein
MPWLRGIVAGFTTETRVHVRVSSRVIYGGQSGSGTDFLRILRYSPVNIIPPWLSILVSSGE